MKNILILETEYEGHYLTGYIKYILRSFKNNNVRITLLTSHKAKIKAIGAFKILKKENINFSIKIVKNVINKNYTTLHLFWNQVKFFFLVKKKFKSINSKYRYDYVLVTSIQKFDKALAIFGSPFGNVNFSGIYLDIKFHLESFGISARSRFNNLSSFFFRKLLNISKLENIITNDHLLNSFLIRQKWNNYKKIHFLHDPKEFNFIFKKNYSRKILGLSKQSTIILVYGALIETKGIIELLSIFKNNEINKNIQVILAGRQLGKIKFFLKNDTFIKKLKLNKKIITFDKWLSEKEESRIFSASDIVWIGYKSYSSPSGVLYQAVNMNLPIIISNDGLIHHLNKKIKIGCSVNIFNSQEIVKAIDYIINKQNLLKLKNNIKKFSKISNVKNWVSDFKKINKILYS